MPRVRGLLSFPICFVLAFAAIGCRSHGVLVTVRNDSGGSVHNLEVQYPGGSFGKSLLSQNASYSYRVKVLRQGGILVVFDDAQGKTHSVAGPTYPPNADGNLSVTIRQENTVSFAER